jgi:glycosyltransferase involved in cell wall biosynthesis
MRVILIDPNLKNFAGHSMEFIKSLSKYMQFKKWEWVIISNKIIDNFVRNEFPYHRLINLISNNCFEDLFYGKKKFLEDLIEINTKLHFRKEDIVIVITSYINEISATNYYIKNFNKKHPNFCFWVHQLFPPEDNFIEASRNNRKKYWLNRFKKEYSGLVNGINIYTTPSKKLQTMLQKIINKKVNILPLPLDADFFENNKGDGVSTDSLSIGFLGDGRYEKGGLLFLKLVNKLRCLNVKFFIQEAKLRGFPKEDLNSFNSLLEKLQKEKIIHIIKDNLSQKDFYNIIKNIDILVLPYHPKSYDTRTSGILIQRLCIGKPVVVSSNTWLEEEINKSKAGVVFKYDTNNELKTVNNLSKTTEELIRNFRYYKRNAMIASKKYRKLHTAKKFFEAILKSLCGK